MYSRKRISAYTVLTFVVLFAALGSSNPQIAEVNVRKWFGPLTLGPNETRTWFQDNVSQNNVRWFTPVPIGFLGIDTPFADYDQQIEITRVYYILKGEAHARDGSGGQRTLQVNVTVHNLDTLHPVTFDIYGAETR